MDLALVTPLASGLVGALVGAFANTTLRERGERRAAREALFGEIGIYTKDCLSALLELYRSILDDSKGADRWSKRAELERLEGRGMALEVRVFREFRGRKIRAGVHKLLTRIDAVRNALDASNPLDEKRFRLGCHWIDSQLKDTAILMSPAAGIDMVDRARIIFVGWRKVTTKDRMSLSFDQEIVPWEFSITFDLKDELPAEGIETITRRSKERVGDMICPEHGIAPRIILSGHSHDFEVAFDVCCEEFAGKVAPRFYGIPGSDRLNS